MTETIISAREQYSYVARVIKQCRENVFSAPSANLMAAIGSPSWNHADSLRAFGLPYVSNRLESKIELLAHAIVRREDLDNARKKAWDEMQEMPRPQRTTNSQKWRSLIRLRVMCTTRAHQERKKEEALFVECLCLRTILEAGADAKTAHQPEEDSGTAEPPTATSVTPSESSISSTV